ncbi:MAG: DnaT-like ssDNA-binding protein [Candidatus Thorarchaeota archaeon]
MAFLLEDGTGVAGSNGYIDDTFADTYHTDRGQTAWLFSDTAGTIAITILQKQAAIIRATDHIDRVYGTLFKGYKQTDAQGLKWPRTGAYGPNGYVLNQIPPQLQKATAEYALRALLYGVLTPDPPPKGPRQDLTQGSDLAVYGEGEGEIISSREKVGPLETEVRYNPATSGSLAAHPAADMYLRDLLLSRNTEIVRG